MAEDIVVRYRAEVDDLTRQLKLVADRQEEIQNIQEEGQKSINKNITAQEFAAKKRLALINEEEKALAKLKRLRDLSFDTKAIKEYNRQIAAVEKNIQLLSGRYNDEFNIINKAIGNLARGIGAAIGAAFSIGAVIEFGKASINAFLQAQETADRLKFSVLSLGEATEEQFDALVRQSKELQRVSTFSTQSIQQAQTVLANFGLTATQIERLLPSLADFASQTRQDIVAAANQVGSALEGQGRAFEKFGADISTTKTAVENYNEVLRTTGQFTGAAAAETETLSGQLKQIELQSDDLQESIGERLAPAWVKLKNAIFQATLSLLSYGRSQASVLKDQEAVGKAGAQQFIARLNEQGKSSEDVRKILEELIRTQKESNDQLELDLQLRDKSSDASVKLTREQANQINNRISLGKGIIQAYEDELRLLEQQTEEGKRTLSVDELRSKSIKELNELLLENKKRTDSISKSNIDLIQRELEARKKANEEFLKEEARKLEELKKLYSGAKIIIPIEARVEPEKIKKAINEGIPDRIELPVDVKIGLNQDLAEPSNQLTTEQLNEQIAEILTATVSLQTALIGLWDNYTNNRIEQINRERDAQLEALDIREDAVNDNLKKRRISEAEAEAQYEQLRKERTETEKRAAEEERKIKRKQFQLDQAAAIVEITISTAKAVAASLTVPVLAALYAALGAAQGALVASQVNPYRKGSKNTKEGLARVGEEGEEVVFMPGGSKVLPSKQTKTYGQALDAMFDNRFEKYLMDKYVTPALQKQQRTFEAAKQTTFANKVGESIVLNTTGMTATEMERIRKRGQTILNADEIGRSVANHLRIDPYRR